MIEGSLADLLFQFSLPKVFYNNKKYTFILSIGRRFVALSYPLMIVFRYSATATIIKKRKISY